MKFLSSLRSILLVFLILTVFFSGCTEEIHGESQDDALTHKPEIKKSQMTFSMSSSDVVLHQRLEELLKSHPVEAIRTDLFQMIRDGHLVISWTNKNAASFALISSNMARGNGINIPQGTVLPVLFLNPNSLRGSSALQMQLTLYHEYVHIEQMRSGEVDWRTFLLKPIDLNNRDAVNSLCKKKWYAELNAYQAECRLAQKMGVTNHLGFCDQLQSQTSLSAFYEQMKRWDANGSVCDQAWKSFELKRTD